MKSSPFAKSEKFGTRICGAESVESVEKISSRLSPLYVDLVTEWVPQETCKGPAGWGAALASKLSRFNPEEQLEGAPPCSLRL